MWVCLCLEAVNCEWGSVYWRTVGAGRVQYDDTAGMFYSQDEQ